MRRYGLYALFIALTLFLSFTVVAQDIEVFHTSLNILSVTPAPDAMNVNPSDGQIVVMFDRSVVSITELSQPKSLLHFEPDISGTGEWVHPAIYRFTPEKDAVIGGMTYEVTLTERIEAIDGAILDVPYGWSFRTIAPQVIEIKPTHTWTDKWTTLRDSAFVVTFTQPMDRPSTQAAFTVERYVGSYCYDGCSQRPSDWMAIEGYFSWNVENTEMTFTPTELLDYSVPDIGSYRASLTTDALNSSGSA